jgi:hypothetical protein
MKRPEPADTRWGPSPRRVVLALAAAGGGLLLAWPGSPSDPPPARQAAAASAPSAFSLLAAGSPREPATSAPAAAAATATPAIASPHSPHIPRQRDPNGDTTPDLADYVNEGERPTMAEVIDRLHAAGVRTGLGAFSPPGTRPPLVGLAVPEGFELPAGYVRHHQATDDGQRIEPVLMFAPDAATLVINGRTVAVPADRVVPPELAPPGLPLRRIVVPAPVDGRGLADGARPGS